MIKQVPMFTIQNTLLFFSTLFCALVAGLLYGYACSVNPGLGKLTDAGYLRAMQSINREIQNPVFFICFFGTVLLLPITAWKNYYPASPQVFYLLLAAALLYIIGVFGVTVFGNVPLNENLARIDIDQANATEMMRQRGIFETAWNRLHTIRTICAVLSLVCTVASIFKLSSK